MTKTHHPFEDTESSAKKREALLEISLGPEITHYLQQDNVKEIMLNPDGLLWIETHTDGKKATDYNCSATQARRIITVVASLNNKTVTKANPILSGTIERYQARFQGWLPPITSQPTFCIRKQATIPLTLDDWIRQESITPYQVLIITEAIRDKKNIIVCGGTGSGKTTLTNTLLHEVEQYHERIIIIEDTPELHINSKDHVSLLTNKDFTMRDCLAGTLRMRPDRIIIGEVRDGSALDLLKAWNTGHGGGIATLHANNPLGALRRLEDLSMEAKNHRPHHLITEVVNLIIYMEKDPAGAPKLKALSKVCGFEHNKYILKDLT